MRLHPESPSGWLHPDICRFFWPFYGNYPLQRHLIVDTYSFPDRKISACLCSVSSSGWIWAWV